MENSNNDDAPIQPPILQPTKLAIDLSRQMYDVCCETGTRRAIYPLLIQISFPFLPSKNVSVEIDCNNQRQLGVT